MTIDPKPQPMTSVTYVLPEGRINIAEPELIPRRGDHVRFEDTSESFRVEMVLYRLLEDGGRWPHAVEIHCSPF